MKILINGSGGFIGNQLRRHLTDQFDVISLSRKDLDFTDSERVTSFFKDNFFDVVFHVAAAGIKSEPLNCPLVLQNNLLMFFNLLKNKRSFGKLIHFSSGAELDRFGRDSITDSSSLLDVFPVDSYGMSKNIISRICQNENSCYNFRIFNVFGLGELPSRMITKSLNSYTNREDIIVHKNKFMDFFYIKDLIALCKFYVLNKMDLPKTIDCCYSDKLTLLDIANSINNTDTHKVSIKLIEQGMGPSYTGHFGALGGLSLELVGFRAGLSEMYKDMAPCVVSQGF